MPLVGAFLGSCQEAGEAPPPSYETVRPADQATFTMLALRSGALFAYNPAFHENVLTTRYSDHTRSVILPLVAELPPSCVFAGFAGSVQGHLVRGGRRNSFRLQVDSVAGIRALQELERQRFRDLSPAIRHQTIC